MRKWNTLFLMLALLLVPAAGSAQELPELFSAVYSGAKEGLQSGMQQAAAGMERELTLGIAVQNAKRNQIKNVDFYQNGDPDHYGREPAPGGYAGNL